MNAIRIFTVPQTPEQAESLIKEMDIEGYLQSYWDEGSAEYRMMGVGFFFGNYMLETPNIQQWKDYADMIDRVYPDYNVYEGGFGGCEFTSGKDTIWTTIEWNRYENDIPRLDIANYRATAYMMDKPTYLHPLLPFVQIAYLLKDLKENGF